MPNDRILRRTAFLIGCASAAAIAFATLSPIAWRPSVAGAGAGVEHVAAFAIVGLFLGLARPDRRWLVGLLIVLAAIALEAAQHVVPGRHGRWMDLAHKIIGGGLGLGLAALVELSLSRFAAKP